MSSKSWGREYADHRFLPSSRTTKISRALRLFLRKDFRRIPKSGPALDLGCGSGRNIVVLAKHRKVIGLDYSREAIRQARQLARRHGVAQRITYKVHDLSKRWPVANSSCALAIDMSCIHLLNPRQRKTYADELKRVLQPGGYFLIFTIASGALTGRWRRARPGRESGSYVVSANGHTEKAFTAAELKRQFHDLRPIALRPMSFVTRAFGQALRLHYHYGIFQKPKGAPPA